MRAYTVATSAVVLGVTRKWVDNVLSHYRVPGVLQERQGIVRKVTPAALLRLELCVSLVRSLNVPILQGLEVAEAIIKADGGEIGLAGAPALGITADLQALASDLQRRIDAAIEMSPTPKRGRPARKKSGASVDAPL